MNEHKRETLARLREAVGRIMVEKTPRRGFTAKQRQAVWDDWQGLCACCSEPIGDEPWDIDHTIPIALGGRHELGNWQPLIRSHHRDKSKADVKAIAKVNRLLKQGTVENKSRKIVSRGFDKTLRKRMNGTVEKRR